MNLNNKIQEYIKKIIFFVLVFFDSSFFFVNQVNGYIVVFINLIAVISLLFYTKKINKNYFVCYSLTLLLILFNSIIYGNIKQTVILFISLTGAFLFVNYFEIEVFSLYYNNIIYFIAIYSLIFFMINFFYPVILYKNPLFFQSAAGIKYFNYIFSIVSNNTYVLRNYGFFWEPGAFAIFLNIALYIELNVISKKQKKRILIYLITIISTLSTLGIISMLLQILPIIFVKKEHTKNNNRLFILFIIMVLFIIMFINKDYVIFHVFEKLNTSGETSSTTLTRINAIIYPMNQFLKSPFFGIGMNNFLLLQNNMCNGMATCTYVNWLCIYGIGGLLFVLGSTLFFVEKKNTIIEKIAYFILSILLFSTENFLMITFIYIIFFYGINKYIKFKC